MFPSSNNKGTGFGHSNISGSKPLSSNVNTPAIGGTVVNHSSKLPIKSLSQSDMDDWKKRSLYFLCSSKYTSGHRCTKAQLYQLVIDPMITSADMLPSPTTEEFQDCSDQLETDGCHFPFPSPFITCIAMHSRIPRYETGSLHCSTGVAADRLQVLTASGDKLFTQGLCHSVNWTIQDFQFSTNFLLLPIKGCDLVLGTQWLLSLGPVVWDFSHLTMQFNYQNQ